MRSDHGADFSRLETLCELGTTEDLKEAIDIVEALPEPLRASPRVLIFEGRARHLLGSGEEARSLLSRALRGADGDDEVTCRASLWLAEWWLEHGDRSSTLAYAEEARLTLPATDRGTLAGAVAFVEARALRLEPRAGGPDLLRSLARLATAYRCFMAAKNTAGALHVLRVLADVLEYDDVSRAQFPAELGSAREKPEALDPKAATWPELRERGLFDAREGKAREAAIVLSLGLEHANVRPRERADALLKAADLAVCRAGARVGPLLDALNSLGPEPDVLDAARLVHIQELLFLGRNEDAAKEARTILSRDDLPKSIRDNACVHLASAILMLEGPEAAAAVLPSLDRAADSSDEEFKGLLFFTWGLVWLLLF